MDNEETIKDGMAFLLLSSMLYKQLCGMGGKVSFQRKQQVKFALAKLEDLHSDFKQLITEEQYEQLCNQETGFFQDLYARVDALFLQNQ